MNVFNKDTNSSHVLHKLLSRLGKRIYFPEGIVAQAEQSQNAKIRATAGMALNNSSVIVLPELQEQLPNFTSTEIVAYAPVAGLPQLRAKWKERMIKNNPSINIDCISTPMVTSGLTHAISNILHLMLDEEDILVTPDYFWENYQHIAETVLGATMMTFPMFSEDKTFNVHGLDAILNTIALQHKKAVILLNFPNNPTGYSLKKDEVQKLFNTLHKHAESGVPILTITDDAYFGLFYEEDIYQESLFAQLSQLHENIFAVKVDGATKELLVWGFRVGFFTFGCKNLPKNIQVLLEQKMMAYIRATVTSTSRLSQTLTLNMLQSETLEASLKTHRLDLQERFNILQTAITQAKSKYPNTQIIPAPCNSGYFVSFICESEARAHDIRTTILEQEDIALISLSNKIRFAFSCINTKDIPFIIDTIYRYAHMSN